MADLLSKAWRAFVRPVGYIPLLHWQTTTRLLGWGSLPPYQHKGPVPMTLFALDLPGGRLTPLSHPQPYFSGSRGIFSPDGQWLLQGAISASDFQMQALHVDGKQRRLWKRDEGPGAKDGLCPASSPIWAQDGGSWVQLLFRTLDRGPSPLMAVTGRLDQPGRVRTISMGSVSDATGGYVYWGTLLASRLIDCPDGDLLVGVNSEPFQHGVRLLRYRMRLSQKGRDREEQVLLRDQGQNDSQSVGDWDYCPTTRRLALLLGAELVHGGSQRLCVMNLDGRQMLELGQIKGGREQFARNIQWLPGGRQLSFERRDGVWLLDVPPVRPSDARLLTSR